MASIWTPEQKVAINADRGSVIVSAAAGSGKTSVLVQRLIRQLSDSENRIPVEKIVVVTFTKDAAAEMKKRLVSAFSKLIKENNNSSWVRRQHAMLQYSKITTVHSFCFDLIRDNINMLDISHGFKILEENGANIIITKAIKEVLEEAYEKMPSDMEILRGYFCDAEDYVLDEILRLLYDFIYSIPFGISWLDNTIKNYSENSNSLKKRFFKGYAEQYKDICQKYGELSKLCISCAEDKLTAFIAEESAMAIMVRDKFLGGETVLDELEFKRFPTIKNKSAEIEFIKNRRESLKKALSAIAEKTDDIVLYADKDFNSHVEILKIMEKLLIETEKNVWAQKVKKNSICFNDAEQLVIKLLCTMNDDGTIEKTSLANQISEKYSLIMVDEFQDTNNSQDLIFKLLSHNGTHYETGDNVFMVGDVKQAIYRFRMANPENFTDILKKSSPYSDEDEALLSNIKLNRNFRSSGSVINFVNFIFSNIMSSEVGETDYTDDEKLIQGLTLDDDSLKTEIMLAYENDTEPHMVAKKIADMLKFEYPVLLPDGTSRPCQNRDFCILMRNRKKTELYINELERMEVAVYAEEADGYIKSREVSILLNFLRIIDNPLLDTALASVLLSPMFMLNADDISKIRLVNRETSLYGAICEGIGIGENPPVLGGTLLLKVQNFYKTLADMRLHSIFCTVEELIRRIYDSTDFMSVLKIYKDSSKRRANLRLLIEYAKEYEENASSSSGGISGFLNYIDTLQSIGKDFRQAATVSTSENVVTIKTIHKSKGLEYPFIFIAESDTKFSSQDSRKVVLTDYKNGIGFKLHDKEQLALYNTMPYEMILSELQKNQMSEEMRLLYVALTRAKNKLFISLKNDADMQSKVREYAESITKERKISTGLVMSADSMADWILMCLSAEKESDILREECGVQHSLLLPQNADVVYTFDENDNIEEEIEDNSEISMEKDTDTEDKIRYNINFEYNSKLTLLQSKLSVSEVTKTDMDFNAVLKRPKFMTENYKLTPAEKGTAMHNYLQYADFKAAKENPKEELARLVKYGYITKRQAESIDITKLSAFFSSDIYRLCENAKKIMREKKFLVKISDMELNDELGKQYAETDGMLNGIMDLVIDDGDGLILVDYKTDYVKEFSELAERYAYQLYLYKKATELTSKKRVKAAYIYSFSLDNSFKIEF